MIRPTYTETLQGSVTEYTAPDAKVYTDESTAYNGVPHNRAILGWRLSQGAGSHQRHRVVRSILKRPYTGMLRMLGPNRGDTRLHRSSAEAHSTEI